MKKRNPSGNPQKLTAKNIYILPSGFGWAYGLVLLTLFSGAINYQISTIFLMTFLLAITGMVSAWEAHANLQGLEIKLIAIQDAPQGNPVQVTLLIQSPKTQRFALELRAGRQPEIRLELIPATGLQFVFPIPTSARGCFTLPPIAISSLFPFGIFRVWGYAFFDEVFYVYPQALSPDFWPIPLAAEQDKNKHHPGDDEIYDLKQVDNPWVQPNLIAWKIAAKGQGWYLKNRHTSEGDLWSFNIHELPNHSIETRLQYLSYWIQTAESNGYCYNLNLGYSISPFSQGEEHLQQCLRQLALYQ